MSDFVRPSANVVSILRALSQLPNTYVYILSGRSRKHLDQWFSSCGVGLSAEHGCFYKHPDSLHLLDVPMLSSLSVSSNDSFVGSEQSAAGSSGKFGWKIEC